MLTQESKADLIRYRIDRAHEVFREAEDNARLRHWNLTGNRLYYAVFHMCQALLLTENEAPRRHAGMIHKIGMDFIAKGKLDRGYGRLITRLYELRQSGDYDEKYNASEEEIMPYFETVERMLSDMESLIERQMQP